MSEQTRCLVLFDLDGTLTYKDSLFDFIRFAVGARRYYQGLVAQSANLVAYKLGFLRNDIAKQRLFSHFFKGLDSSEFRAIAKRYSQTQLPNIIRKDAMDCLNDHIAMKHDVVVVSASIEDWIAQWCRAQNIELIATKIETVNDMISGKFSTPNCHGIEKVNRIKTHITISDYAKIVAYGDSSGDTQMLELADEGFLRHFTARHS